MILFAVVIYKKRLSDSATVRSLAECLKRFPQLDYRVLLMDNSEPGLNHAPQMENWEFHSFGANVGLPRAYNHALTRCDQLGADYLVTLDQDSVVTEEYLADVVSSLGSLNGATVALCPIIRSSGRVVSPYVFNRFGMPVYGARTGSLFAINSFAVYSTKYLRTVSGFDEYYWLDALDFSIFARINQQELQVQCLDVIVEHDLSLISGAMAEWRFANIVRFESIFLAEYCGPLHALTGFSRLLARVLLCRRYKLDMKCILPNVLRMIGGGFSGLRRRYTPQAAQLQREGIQ